MRTAPLTGIMLVACSFAASAQQFTVLPQMGLEVARTSIRYNNASSFEPANKQLAPQLGVRMDYTFKKGHGPFVGLATSRSGLNYEFADPATGMNDYKVSTGNLRMNLQAGYQLTTKPIYFGKSGAKKIAAPPAVRPSQGRCGRSAYGNRCSRFSESARQMAAQAAAKETGWSMVIHPLAGLALTSAISPGVNTKMENGQSVYEYAAGNWNTAIITGAAFEFGKNDERKFTISMNCVRGIGNLGTSSIATTSNGKTTVTNIKSSVSSWNLTAGIPLTIYKKKPAIKHVQLQSPPPHHNRGRFEGRCGGARYFQRAI